MSYLKTNKCQGIRGEVEGKSYRIVSLFYEHPGMIDQSEWTVLHTDGGTFIVDKRSMTIFANCVCEFMSVGESNAITAIRLTYEQQNDGINIEEIE